MFSEVPGTDEFSVFDVDNRKAAAAMVRYLITQGHRRIAHIAGADASLEARERSSGYTDALREAGLPVDPALLWRGGLEL